MLSIYTLLANEIAPVFYKLIYMSITALVAGLLILLIRWFADKRFSPFWKYAMWALVLAALLVPWRPESNLAVLNNTELVQEISFQSEYAKAEAGYDFARQIENPTPEQARQIAEAKNKTEVLRRQAFIFDSLLPALWLFGAAVIGLFTLAGGLRLSRKIKHSKIPLGAERYKNILQRCKQKLGIKRSVEIIMQGYIKTPALFGLFRPKIILPDYAESMSDGRLEYIILHELSHLKRFDGVVNALLLVLQTVYWFNPLTWLLFKFIREDMELANDAAVLAGMSEKQQKEYSLSLVEVLAGYGKIALTPRLLCMVDSEKNMERRINMIKLGEFFKRRRLIIAIAGVLVIVLIAALFLTTGATDRYRIEITDSVIDNVEQQAQMRYQFAIQGDNGFVITAVKIHRAYMQNDQIRIFATICYSAYMIDGNTIIECGAGTVPASITCTEPTPGRFEILDYTEAQDGGRFGSSIEEFCRLPSGQKIKGLASEILEYYGDYGDLLESRQQRLESYIINHGLVNYEIQNDTSFFTNLSLSDEILQTLWDNKTPYIGDNSKVYALIKALGDPPYIAFDSFSLSTNVSPYGLTILYKETAVVQDNDAASVRDNEVAIPDDEAATFDYYQLPHNQRAFESRTLLLFCLIGNADFVRFEILNNQAPTGSFEYTYTREWADAAAGGNIENFAKDFDTFKMFANSATGA